MLKADKNRMNQHKDKKWHMQAAMQHSMATTESPDIYISLPRKQTMKLCMLYKDTVVDVEAIRNGSIKFDQQKTVYQRCKVGKNMVY